MNAIRRLLAPAALFSAVFALSAASVAAQNPCEDQEGIVALDANFRTYYSKTDTLPAAIEVAKEYLKRYGACSAVDEFAGWLRTNLPKLEQTVADQKIKEKIKRFDDAVKAKNYDEVYAFGKEILQRYPDNVHFMLPMALIGLPETYKKNYKYNDDAIRFAKMAIERLKTGPTEPKKGRDGKPITDATGEVVYGPFQFQRNAEEGISELTYGIGYILYHAKKDKRAGLLYLYEASQLPGMYSTEPQLYFTIGQYYSEEAAPIGKEIVALIEKQKAAEAEDDKAKLEVEIRAKAALFNGYRARELDAFSRAYRFSDEKIPSEKALKANLYAKLGGSMGPEAKERLDKLVAASEQTPLPDPTSEVTPIEEPEPAAAEPASPGTKGKPAVKSKATPIRKRKP